MNGAARAELRAVAWGQVVGPVAVGAVLLALTASGLNHGPEPVFVWLALGACALGAAACLDDPSAVITAACPTGRRRRTLPRLAASAVLVPGWCVVAAGLDGVNGFSGRSLALTGAGLVVAAVATSDVLRRCGVDEPGAVVGSAVLLLVLTCLFFQPFGDVLVMQGFDDRGSAGWLWPLALALAAGCLAITSGDPAGARLRSRSIAHRPTRRRSARRGS